MYRLIILDKIKFYEPQLKPLTRSSAVPSRELRAYKSEPLWRSG